ncbi:hypothetical protein LEP1GSC043_3936 [Leptospira weilii str. Ecochallenge]|uniref:Uncharacterized protein n=2 Tax=Leptospira weilii TaxID=28184 RepID=N1U1R7_9LEPT|nr:hypothetical protein LEP1GSC108_3444 [Leptospira weilii str. UI 13098]EMY12937.1 hypothetical protein LEP1GSC043_3936 [Leptospira weilii str. Ecochallenge]
MFPKKLISFQDIVHSLEIAVPIYNSRPSSVLFGILRTKF